MARLTRGAWGRLRSRLSISLERDGEPRLGNALVGVDLAFALWMWPISNLFVETFLWKVGFAHAGLAAFLHASLCAPQRLYGDMYGAAAGTRLAVLLGMSAVTAGLAAAILYRFSDLAIHYKLAPEPMW